MNKRMKNLIVIGACIAAAMGSAACASAQTSDSSRALAATHDTVPVGFGSLKQDEITLAVRTGALLVKVTPLNESLIRLMAPDTYRRLHALKESHKQDLAKAMGPQEYYMVSFFSYQPDVTFQPEDVQLSHEGRTLRPTAIVPLTPGWGKQRMAQQETQTALYAFDGPIDYQQDVVLQYGTEHTDAWTTIIPRLQQERAKVKAQSGH